MHYQEKELFEGYEQRNWEFSPRIYKIVGAAALLNLFGIFVLAQGNLLTRKGCDSPLVSSVCQVLDTVMLGSSMLGTDGEFVSKDYEKNELENADVVMIDVTNQAPPLKYPEGYFALANPEQALMQNAAAFPTSQNYGTSTFGGFSTATTVPPVSATPSTDLLGSTPTLPPSISTPYIGELPKSTSGSLNGSYKKPKPYKFPLYKAAKPSKILPNESPNDLPEFGGTTGETAKNKAADKPKTEKSPEPQKPIESEKVAGVEINKKPFEDLGDTLNDKLDKKEIDLNKPFFVVLDATVMADGKFDPNPKKTKYTKYEGDPAMVEIAKQAIASVGYSGILGYLKQIGVDKVNFTLVQDEKQIYAIIVSDQKTPEKAQTTASGFNTLLKGLILANDTGLKKLDDNSIALVKNSSVTSENKNFVFKFNIPKPMGQDLIKKSLADRAEKNSQPDSNGLSQNTSK